MRNKFVFGCLLPEKTQIKLKEYAIQGKKRSKQFSQGKIVDFALNRLFKEIEREGLEFIFGLGKKSVDY